MSKKINSIEDAGKATNKKDVEDISFKDQKITMFDFSVFPNIHRIDASNNQIEDISVINKY